MTTTATMKNPVTPELLNRFDQDGYVVVEDALSPEKVSELMAVLDRIEERLRRSEHRQDVFGLNIRPVVTEDDAFLELMEWPATFPLAVRCLGHWNIQLMTSHLIKVPPQPEAKRKVAWHSDGGKMRGQVHGIQPFQSLKVGFFLTDLLEPNMGSLMVVPGSHRMSGPPPRREGARDPDGAVELKLKAGSAVIFQQGVWHGGAPNLSDQTRVVLYYGYGSRLLRPIDYEKMPEDLLDRCTPIARQLLGAKASHLGYHKPSEEDVPLRAWYRERFGEAHRK